MRCLLILLLALAGNASVIAQGPKRYFVGVGIDEYRHKGLSSTKFCQSDAERLGKFFKEQSYEVTLLVSKAGVADSIPNKANIERAITGILEKAGRDDVVVLFFATQGLQFEGSDDALLIPFDGIPIKEEKNTLISMKWLSEKLDNSLTEGKIVLVDACRNDPEATRNRGGVTAASPAAKRGSYAFLYSCRPGEHAFETKELGGGLFTHALLEGLLGGATDDAGKVTFLNLAEYVCQMTPELSKKHFMAEQTPIVQSKLSSSIVLVPKQIKKPLSESGAVASNDSGSRRYAVLVGVEDYAHESLRSPKLKYPIEDVTEFGALLKEHGYEVVLLTDDEGAKNPDLVPNRKNIEAACQNTLDAAGRSDTVLLAFAGHGVQFAGDKDAYFCPQDAKPFAEKKATLVSLEKLNGELKSSFAGVKLILVDACRNDPDPTRGRGGVDADNAPPPPKGVMALFSCAAGQKAFENDTLKHGVFFHYVIEGLKSEDLREPTGEMKFSRLSSFVCDNVPTKVLEITKDREQSPNLKTDVAGRSPILLPKRSGNAFKAGDIREFTDLKIKFCYCPPGKFLMGSPSTEKDRSEDEDDTEGEGGSQVEVTLTKGFWLGQTEVTQKQWIEVMGTRPWRKEDGSLKDHVKERDDVAASYISHNEAMEYCDKLTERERSAGRLKGIERYTLPTEAQWEYACRAGSKTIFNFGDDEGLLEEFAQYSAIAFANEDRHPQPVASKRANPWNLYDAHGNVSEWCLDCYNDHLKGGIDPVWTGGTSNSFIRRGGGWTNEAVELRSSYRYRQAPTSRNHYIGFRLAKAN